VLAGFVDNVVIIAFKALLVFFSYVIQFRPKDKPFFVPPPFPPETNERLGPLSIPKPHWQESSLAPPY